MVMNPAPGNPFTGLFQQADYCFARLSLAAEPNPAVDNIVPAMSIKCLRDRMDSANLVSMYEVTGQADWNFFANTFSNHIPT